MYEHERSLVQRMTNRPFALIGINSDASEKIQEALERENITWRSFFNGGTTRGPISKAWGVTGWPTVFVLDHEGVIRYKNVRGEAMDKAADELVELAIQAVGENVKSADPAVRGLAAFRMGRYGAPDAVATLLPLLDDSDAVVQQRTATGLALVGQPVEPLLAKIRPATSDVDPDVRIASLEVLAGAKDAESAPLAIKALDDAVVTVRLAALKALGQLGDPATVPAVAKMLDDPKFRIARDAAFALAAMPVPESVELLGTLAAKGDHPARVWIAAAIHRVDPTDTDLRVKGLMADQDALTRRRTARVLPDLKDYDPTDVFIAALEDVDDVVSKSARTFLAKSPLPRAQEALKQFYVARLDKLVPILSGQDDAARGKAQSDIFALGPDVAPMLMERLLQLEDNGAFSRLASVVGALRNPEVVPTVIAQLRDPDLDENRRTAFEGFARSFSDQLTAEALAIVKSDLPALRLSAVRILSTTLDDRAPPVLKSALPDPDLRVRAAAAVGLSRLKDQDALAVLQELATQSDRTLQQQAILGLANYDEETAFPRMQELLKSDDQAARLFAFNALQRFKGPKVTALIVEEAAADERLRRLAPSVLRWQGTADAARALSEFLKSDDLALRRLAEQQLERMRIPEAQAILQEFRKQQQEQEKPKAEAEAEKKDG